MTLVDLRNANLPESVVTAVDALNKGAGQSSREYLEGVRKNPPALRVKLVDIADNESPERLAKLDVKTQERLRQKYVRAKAVSGEWAARAAAARAVTLRRCVQDSRRPTGRLANG